MFLRVIIENNTSVSKLHPYPIDTLALRLYTQVIERFMDGYLSCRHRIFPEEH